MFGRRCNLLSGLLGEIYRGFEEAGDSLKLLIERMVNREVLCSRRGFSVPRKIVFLLLAERIEVLLVKDQCLLKSRLLDVPCKHFAAWL